MTMIVVRRAKVKAKAVGYVRCSTGAQVASGLGLEAQRKAIEDHAKLLGLELNAVHGDEGVSGGLALADRPGLLDAVAYLKRGDVLIVARRDRLGRDVVNVALVEREITKRGARVVSAAGEGSEVEGPTGDLVRGVLDLVNAHEKKMIGLRTRLALRAKRARGERTGTVPFGFSLALDGRTLVPNPDEERVMALARELRAGGLKLREVVTALHERKVVGRTGKPLGLSQVHAIVKEHDAA
jgi:DNA invertase Pin-like site-specific DNA recombinase